MDQTISTESYFQWHFTIAVFMILLYWVKSFSGTYYFDYRTKEVTLDTGVEIKKIDGITFEVIN